MKTLLYYGLAAIALTACSKKNDSPGQQNKNVTIQDIKNYYITAIITDVNTTRLATIYFYKDSAVLDELGLRRQLPISLTNNQLTYDINSNGVAVFTFTLKKDSAGSLTLETSDYKRSDASQSKLNSAQIVKVSDAPAFINIEYAYTIPGADDDTYLHFGTGDKWSYEDYGGKSGQYSYYLLGNGQGWKCEDAASGGSSMGIMVPKWDGNGPVMLLQTTVKRLDPSRIHVATHN
ncbi:MAG: hypothetical protein JST68_03775 [Bacteroidetes bacterium]|nr:hypothetical protein [Bacteroidota bacterium]